MGSEYLGSSRPQLETILILEKSNLKRQKSFVFLDWKDWAYLFKRSYH